MRIEKTIPIGEHNITIRELTVGDIRAILLEAANQQGQLIDPVASDAVDVILASMLLPDANLQELLAMAPMEQAVLDSLTDSELQALRDKCKELNPLFFGMKDRLQAAKDRAEIAALTQLSN